MAGVGEARRRGVEQLGGDMRGIETGGDSEMAYRRGYEHEMIELFYAIERFLDPRTQEGKKLEEFLIEKTIGKAKKARKKKK
jgi:hypothetical protein